MLAKNSGNELNALRDANVSSQFINSLISKMDSPKVQSLLGMLNIDKNSVVDSLNTLSSTQPNNAEPKVQDSDIERLRRGLDKL